MGLSIKDLSSDQKTVYDGIWEYAHGRFKPERRFTAEDYDADETVEGVDDRGGLSAVMDLSDVLTVGGYAGCLSGDTVLQYSRGARVGHRPITLRDLYLKFNGHRGSGRGVAQRWVDLTVPVYLFSLWPDGTVAGNRIVAVFESGVKKVVRIDFDDGNYLVLTRDHPVATPDGFIAAGDFTVGDVVLGRGSLRPVDEGKGRRPLNMRLPRVIVNTKYHPNGAYKVVECNGLVYEYVRVARARLVVEASMNDLSYEEFAHALKHDAEAAAHFKYIPDGFDVHHLDEDTLNDDVSNLVVLPHEEHARLRATERNSTVEYVREVRVTNIVEAGEEMTYDIQMESPANNFAANGIFVHNTGKSTVLGVFADQAKRSKLAVAYCAFTGRASSVLARKLADCGVQTTTVAATREDVTDDGEGARRDPFAGMPYCGTIHGLIYRPCGCNKLSDPPVEQYEDAKGKIRNRILPRPKPPDCGCYSGRGWLRRKKYDREYDLIVVDEASMVDPRMLTDLRRYGVPILAVGDHGQLPPVKGRSELMESPDLRLEKIHRQAEGNPIIALSRHIRDGGRFAGFKTDGDRRVRMGSRREPVVGEVYKAGLDNMLSVGVLCWTNRNRVLINDNVRRLCGFDKRLRRAVPAAGEVVICLRNYRGEVPAIYNGMRGVLTADCEWGDKPWLLTTAVEFPAEGFASSVRTICAAQFRREKTLGDIEEMRDEGIDVWHQAGAGQLFDFGYCLTVHKSQGSQFDHAIVFCDKPEDGKEETRRFYYTAVTRAAERLTVLQ
jgi:exodeoxyribonuclease-5